MAMGRFFDNVWLPKEIAFDFGATFAAGSYTFRYTRDFYDYRKGEVSARSAATCRRSRNLMPRPMVRLLVAALLLVAGCAHAMAQGAGPRWLPRSRIHGNYRTPDAEVLRLAGIAVGSSARTRLESRRPPTACGRAAGSRPSTSAGATARSMT